MLRAEFVGCVKRTASVSHDEIVRFTHPTAAPRLRLAGGILHASNRENTDDDDQPLTPF